jgi:hypothetical protein
MAPRMQVPGAQYMWVGYCKAWYLSNSGRDDEDMDRKVGGRAHQHKVRVAMCRCRGCFQAAHARTLSR